ncbi:hypothetical protein [Bacillus sp. EB01]|uniref:hypothetical protein n=1 Tax=Bacillus sp. EB01 TaxID=1347086 RepID=UPI0005C54276|nr:hypothetical protein [Bacillus sp. EB01]
MNIITKEQLENLFNTVNPKLDLSAIITVDDKEIEKVLHYFLFLQEYKDEIVAGSSFTNEQVLYSQYYWFVYFKNHYFANYGYDGGMDQKAFQLIEELTYKLDGELDWNLLERITNELNID